MRLRVFRFTAAAVLGLATMLAGTVTAQASTSPTTDGHPLTRMAADAGEVRSETSVRLCPDTHNPNRAFCLSKRRTDLPAIRVLKRGQQPPGYGPKDIRSAYELTGRPDEHRGGERRRTVAITIAFHDPKLESDLAVYRRQFHLPLCTKANGCLRVINQLGGTTPPSATDPGWAGEESLDVDAVSAACSECRILVVEADNSQTANLLAAVDQAVAQGAEYISNSWGAPESPGEVALDYHFRHPGVAFSVSSGDTGGVTLWPSASPYVTSVGGTNLTRAANRRGWTESAWSDAGNGCSAFEAKPPFQQDSFCPNNRTTADVSAVADPATGLAVYCTGVPGPECNGWAVFGGTSLAAPLITAMYALAGPPTPGTFPNSFPYARPKHFHDIVTGCAGVFCAVRGYDPPTGIGTPNGVRGLRAPRWN
ncbi:S53 family peptidase [Streptomyces sp. NPDC002076]